MHIAWQCHLAFILSIAVDRGSGISCITHTRYWQISLFCRMISSTWMNGNYQITLTSCLNYQIKIPLINLWNASVPYAYLVFNIFCQILAWLVVHYNIWQVNSWIPGTHFGAARSRFLNKCLPSYLKWVPGFSTSYPINKLRIVTSFGSWKLPRDGSYIGAPTIWRVTR